MNINTTTITSDISSTDKEPVIPANHISAVSDPLLTPEKKKELIEVDATQVSENEQLAVSATLSVSDMQEQLTNAVETISNFMNHPIRSVSFLQDNTAGKTVIKIFDVETKELIKQFPSDKIISMAEKVMQLQQEIGEKTGILIDDKV